MVKISWKVYGLKNQDQKESYNESEYYDFSDDSDGTRILEVENYDKTGTHEYVIVRITRDSECQCYGELDGQITDGIFENYDVGEVELINAQFTTEYYHFFKDDDFVESVKFPDSKSALSYMKKMKYDYIFDDNDFYYDENDI